VAQVYVSVGSNINRYRHISSSLDALNQHFGELLISPVYESEPVGFNGSNFFNLVVGFTCQQALGELSALLRTIEYDHGRSRGGPKYVPRTLDIDILTYDDCVGVIDDILLPREEITENAFVLLPLVDIAGSVLHPVLQVSYADLWRDYDKSSQKLWLIDFDWCGRRISSAAS